MNITAYRTHSGMRYRARASRGGMTRTKVFLTKHDAKQWGIKADAELARLAGGLRQHPTLDEAWERFRRGKLNDLKSAKDYVQRMQFWLPMLWGIAASMKSPTTR